MSSLQFHIIWTRIELAGGQFCSVRKCGRSQYVMDRSRRFIPRLAPGKYRESSHRTSYIVTPWLKLSIPGWVFGFAPLGSEAAPSGFGCRDTCNNGYYHISSISSNFISFQLCNFCARLCQARGSGPETIGEVRSQSGLAQWSVAPPWNMSYWVQPTQSRTDTFLSALAPFEITLVFLHFFCRQIWQIHHRVQRSLALDNHTFILTTIFSFIEER